MELIQLTKLLNNLLPSEKIIDVSPNGLQVEGKKEIKKVVTAVSASLETIHAALEWEADALVVHHGLFWQKDSYVIEGVKKKKLELLLKNNLSLFAYHLPLDGHPEIGNNWRAAYEMGWFDLEPFLSFNGFYIGVKGKIKPSTPEELKKMLENYYQHEAACALGGKEEIRSIALVSGGAYKSLTDAVAAQVDAFVTGNFDEPAWHQAFEEKIHFFALGHSATERVGPRALAEYLAKNTDVECTFLDIKNPF